MELRISAMPTEHANAIRRTFDDGFGNTARHVVDRDGGSPCRYCLRRTVPGERVLLYSYRPFAHPSPYQEMGPVFVHADACERYPEDAGIPRDFADHHLILRAYDAHDDISGSQCYAAPGDAARMAQTLLEDAAVAYVHARSYTRGCFLFRIERA